MKYVRVLGVAFVALFAFGVATATTAFALPDLSITLCTGSGCYPLHLEITLLHQLTRLSSTSTGNKTLTGEGLLLLLLTDELTALGTFEALFEHIGNSEGTTCNSIGDHSGEVLTLGTFHIVYTSLAGSSQGLQLGTLYLPLPFKMECGTEKISIRGSALSSIISSGTGAGGTSAELTELSGILEGNKAGVPNIKFYYNDAGVAQQAKLESNAGSGFAQAAEEIGEVTVKALGGKMFVISGR